MNTQYTICVFSGAICLLLAVLLLWSGDSVGLGRYFSHKDSTSDHKPQTTRSSHHGEREMRKKRRLECLAAVEAAFQWMLAMPRDRKADRELLEALAKWAAEDLNGVQRWIEQHDERLPERAAGWVILWWSWPRLSPARPWTSDWPEMKTI